jgi:hypothetical protein
MNYIFSDNIRILYLSWYVKSPKETVKLSKKNRNNRRFYSFWLCPLWSQRYAVTVSYRRSTWIRYQKTISWSITKSIGKPRVSPLRFLNPSAVIRYLICVYASHFFAGRPYHFNQTLRTANKFLNGDNRWVYRFCFEKYWSLMKVRNQPTLRRMKIYDYWTNIRKWNYFNTSFIEDFRK